MPRRHLSLALAAILMLALPAPMAPALAQSGVPAGWETLREPQFCAIGKALPGGLFMFSRRKQGQAIGGGSASSEYGISIIAPAWRPLQGQRNFRVDVIERGFSRMQVEAWPGANDLYVLAIGDIKSIRVIASLMPVAFRPAGGRLPAVEVPLARGEAETAFRWLQRECGD